MTWLFMAIAAEFDDDEGNNGKARPIKLPKAAAKTVSQENESTQIGKAEPRWIKTLIYLAARLPSARNSPTPPWIASPLKLHHLWRRFSKAGVG